MMLRNASISIGRVRPARSSNPLTLLLYPRVSRSRRIRPARAKNAIKKARVIAAIQSDEVFAEPNPPLNGFTSWRSAVPRREPVLSLRGIHLIVAYELEP